MICKIILVFCLGLCKATDQQSLCRRVEHALTPAEMGPPAAGDSGLMNSAIEEKIQPVVSALCNLEKTTDTKMMNMTSKMKAVTSDLGNMEKVCEAKSKRLNSKIRKVTSGLRNLEKTSDAKIENLSLRMKTESDGFYSAVSKLNGSLSNETAKIESKIERLNATKEKTIDNLSTKLENSLEAKMQNLKAELITRMETLLSSTNAPTLPPSTNAPNVIPSTVDPNLLLLRRQQGLCDVQYNNKCFWAIVHDDWGFNYAEAERLCKQSGGEVADIQDNLHYDVVLKYLRTRIPSSRRYCAIWIATKYNSITGFATARDGGQAFVSWRPGNPYSGSSFSSYTAVSLLVRREETNNDQGMWLRYPTTSPLGVVCEI